MIARVLAWLKRLLGIKSPSTHILGPEHPDVESEFADWDDRFFAAHPEHAPPRGIFSQHMRFVESLVTYAEARAALNLPKGDSCGLCNSRERVDVYDRGEARCYYCAKALGLLEPHPPAPRDDESASAGDEPSDSTRVATRAR